MRSTSPAPPSVPEPPSPLPDEKRPWYDLGFNFTPRTAGILLVLLVAGVAFSLGLERLMDRFIRLEEHAISDWIKGFGVFGPLVYIGLLAATIIFSPLPSVPVNIAGGLAFGVVFGTLFTMTGGLIGAAVNFTLARKLGRHYVERKLGARAMGQIDALAERMGARLVFLTRLIPLFSFDWVSYAAGLTAIRFRTYMLATALGMLPPVIGIVYVGDTLLTHKGRSALVFTILVIWSAIPPVAFFIWLGMKALHRRVMK